MSTLQHQSNFFRESSSVLDGKFTPAEKRKDGSSGEKESIGPAADSEAAPPQLSERQRYASPSSIPLLDTP